MGSSCSSGQKEKEQRDKSAKKGKNGSKKNSRGSVGSNSSNYAYEKAPTPPPTVVPAAPVQESRSGQGTGEQTQSVATPRMVEPSIKEEVQLPLLTQTHLSSAVKHLITGNVLHPPPRIKPRKIVLFVCADDKDDPNERSVLLKNLYPKLRTHCAERNFELVFFDPHRRERGLGLEGHALLYLGKQQYEWYSKSALIVPIMFVNETIGQLLLPDTLSTDCWTELNESVADDDKPLLERCYFLDEKAEPACYRLRPITQWDAASEEDSWQKAARVVIQHAEGVLTDDQRGTFLTTYLEDMIKGAITTNDTQRKSCICVGRKFIGQQTAVEPWLQERCTALHGLLQNFVDENHILHSVVHQSEHAQYTDDLCAQLQPLLVSIMDGLIDENESHSPDAGDLGMEKRLFNELAQHTSECQQHSEYFVGQAELLAHVKDYVTDSGSSPLVLYGPPGSGKTAFAAKVVQLCAEWVPNAPVIFRFVGLTPESATTEQLLRSICEQLCVLFGEHPSLASQNIGKLSKELSMLLEKLASLRPVVVVLDGVDQVQSYGSFSLAWVPDKLPNGVKLILTVRDGSPQLQEMKALIQDGSLFVAVPPLKKDNCVSVLQSTLGKLRSPSMNATRDTVESSLEQQPLPLYSVVVASQLFTHGGEELQFSDTLTDQIAELFETLERTVGPQVIQHLFGCLTAAKHGLTDSEIIDLLSLFNATTAEKTTCISSNPHLVWTLVKTHLQTFLQYSITARLGVFHWWNVSFRTIAEQRYLSADGLTEFSSKLVSYFSGSDKQTCVDYPLPDQLLKFGTSYNRRKLDELPLHSHRAGHDIINDYLLNEDWLFAKLCGSDVCQVMEDLTLVSTPDTLLLHHFLETTAYPLACDGAQFFSQLVFRLPQPDPKLYPVMAALHDRAYSAPQPSLLPLVDSASTPAAGDDKLGMTYFNSLHRLKDSTTHMVSLSSEHNEVLVWSIYEQKPVRKLSGIQQPRDIKFVDDTRGLVLCGRELKLYNLDEGKFEVKLKGVMNQNMAFYGLHNDDHVVSLSRNRMYVYMTNLHTGEYVATFKVGEDRFLNSLLVSANGQMCVCGDETQKPFPLLVWDLTSRKLVYDLRIPHHEFITKLSAITSDGHYVVSVCKEVDDPSPNFIIVYDLQSGTLFKKWKPDVNTCSIAISKSGNCVVSGLQDTSLLVWDLGTGACRFSLKGHTAAVDCIVLDDNGVMCATYDSTGRDMSVRVWDIVKGCAWAMFTPEVPIQCCQLSQDGKALVLGLSGRTNILTLVLCNRQSAKELVPQEINFADPGRIGLEVDLSSEG